MLQHSAELISDWRLASGRVWHAGKSHQLAKSDLPSFGKLLLNTYNIPAILVTARPTNSRHLRKLRIMLQSMVSQFAIDIWANSLLCELSCALQDVQMPVSLLTCEKKYLQILPDTPKEGSRRWGGREWAKSPNVVKNHCYRGQSCRYNKHCARSL